MKYLIILFVAGLIQGCATGPLSKANEIYRDYGGVVQKHPDYEAGYFEDWEIATIKKGDIKRNGKRIGRTIDDHHAIFGHFDRREKEFENGSVAKIAYLELFNLLDVSLKETIESLGFEFVNHLFQKFPFALIHVATYQVLNEDKGCRLEDECIVVIKSSVAHIGTGIPGYKGRVSGGSNTNHRVIDSLHGTFISFTSKEDSTFDQREFYKTFSEKLPSNIYVYLNAVEEANVQVSPGKIVAYPYLLNQGKVIKFEIEPEDRNKNKP